MEKKKVNQALKKAVAIKYDPSDVAPKVIAKGKGYIAEKIIGKASDKGIPVYKDKNLVDELAKLELGMNIPPELYEVVAQVLIFISDLDKKNMYSSRIEK